MQKAVKGRTERSKPCWVDGRRTRCGSVITTVLRRENGTTRSRGSGVVGANSCRGIRSAVRISTATTILPTDGGWGVTIGICGCSHAVSIVGLDVCRSSLRTDSGSVGGATVATSTVVRSYAASC